MEKILILGSGEHSINIIEIILGQSNYEIIGILDPNKKDSLLGIPILGGDDLLLEMGITGEVEFAFPAVGWGQDTESRLREVLYNKIKKFGFKVPNVISSQAIISGSVKFGDGNFVQAGTVIEARTEIGSNVLIGANVAIANDCKIFDHASISAGVCMSGQSTVGKGSIIGTGAIIYSNVGNRCKIAPGSICLTSDIPDGYIAFGNPVRCMPKLISKI